MSNYTFIDEDHIAFHPGYYVEEELEISGLSQEDFARKLDTTPKNLCCLIKGEQRLSMDMAVKLARTTGSDIEYWLNTQRKYDMEMETLYLKKELEQERLVYKELDYQFFQKNYALPKLPGENDAQIEEVRKFLKISTLSVLRKKDLGVKFRNLEEISETDIIRANAMMQIAMNQISSVDITDFNRRKLNRLLMYAVKMTEGRNYENEIRVFLNDVGILFIPMPELRGTGIVSASKKIGHHIILVANLQEKTSAQNVRRELEYICDGEYGVTVKPA